jgi:nucleotide-binding universal stress UspA family protein
MLSTIAAGTDGSSTAGEAVAMAVELARRFDAKLVLLSAFKDSPGVPRRGKGHPGRGLGGPKGSATELAWTSSSSARVREILSRTEDELRRQGIDSTTRADAGDPADVLVQLAGESGADLLVIGNKGMERRVLGSVPNAVTHKAPCSVLVIKTT